jgi:hypothetical protein
MPTNEPRSGRLKIGIAALLVLAPILAAVGLIFFGLVLVPMVRLIWWWMFSHASVGLTILGVILAAVGVGMIWIIARFTRGAPRPS